jgi:antitoxin component of MazEF toxin-antitoxin module
MELIAELHLEEGDEFSLNVQDTTIILTPTKAALDSTASSLKDYAYTQNPDPAEERRWVARHIAETADNYEGSPSRTPEAET